MHKDRIQKKVEGWDPLGQAHSCLENLKKAVDECDATGSIAATGCVFGNAEAAFYEHQIDEDEMVSLKESAADFRKNFSSRNPSSKCRCSKK